MTDRNEGHPDGQKGGPSIGTLINQMTDSATRLIKAEIASAKAEMAEKAKNAGIGIGLFVGAGLFALYGLGFLLHSAMAGLANVVPLWLAALIVGLVLMILAGVLAMVGKKLLSRGLPPQPTHAVKSVQRDIAAVKEGISS
ncbi:phage holin family protein [Sanguibacter sp. 25GB23B1]|uniref:phage holin family protein n=1 Tax=unclassified Sanguibacter TaxID=2645534 RepID=UPI0032AEFBD2